MAQTSAQSGPNRTSLFLTLLLVLMLGAGCISTGPENPSFPLTTKQGSAALKEMAAVHRPLDRPLVVVSGYMDSNAPALRRILQESTGDGRIIAVSLGAPDSLVTCREKILEAVDASYPSADPIWTAEVDVVAVSLGGLAARYAAAPLEDPAARRLHVARLFTIASPHRGAVLAKNYFGDSNHLWRDLRPGSKLLEQLAALDASAGYALYPYARRHDGIVGECNAAPPGQNPIWVSALPFHEGHDDVWKDPRILADILRRLRGEPGFATLPSTPLPD